MMIVQQKKNNEGFALASDDLDFNIEIGDIIEFTYFGKNYKGRITSISSNSVSFLLFHTKIAILTDKPKYFESIKFIKHGTKIEYFD